MFDKIKFSAMWIVNRGADQKKHKRRHQASALRNSVRKNISKCLCWNNGFQNFSACMALVQVLIFSGKFRNFSKSD